MVAKSGDGPKGITQHAEGNICGLKGVAYYMAMHLPPTEKVEVKQYSHFVKKKGPKRKCSDEDIQEIRDLQASGYPKKIVYETYSHLSKPIFYNIWTGLTAGWIVGKPKDELYDPLSTQLKKE